MCPKLRAKRWSRKQKMQKTHIFDAEYIEKNKN